MTGSVKLTVQDYIATVVMDRPPVNAQNSEFRQELITTFDSLTDRDDVRVAILTGVGKMFSAGADMKERPDPEHPGEYWHFNRLARECFNAIAECAKPVIAAVNGPALGAGLGLAASGDPIDALTSIRGELREEVNGVVTSRSAAGAVITLPLAASAGTTLAVPDTERARHALLRAGSVRIDVVGSDGRPIDTLKARRRPRLAARAEARHPRRVRRSC